MQITLIQKGIFFKILNVSAFTIMSVFIIKLGNKISAEQILFLRVSVGFLLSFLFLIFIRKKIIFNIGYKQFLMYALRGLTTLLGLFAWVKSLTVLGLNEAMSITYMMPIWNIIFASIICKEKPLLICILALLINIVGMLIILQVNTDNFELSGILYIIGATTMWSINEIICKIQGTTQHYMLQSLYMFFFSSLLCAPFALHSWQTIVMEDIIYIFIVSTIGVANIIFLFLSYKYAPMSVVMPFSYFRLVFTAILAYFVFDATISLNFLIGASLIIITNSYLYTRMKNMTSLGIVTK